MKLFNKYQVLFKCKKLSCWGLNFDLNIYKLSVYICKNGDDNSFCDSPHPFSYGAFLSNDNVVDE